MDTEQKQGVACPWHIVPHDGQYLVQMVHYPFSIAYSSTEMGKANNFLAMAYDSYARIKGVILTNDAGEKTE